MGSKSKIIKQYLSKEKYQYREIDTTDLVGIVNNVLQHFHDNDHPDDHISVIANLAKYIHPNSAGKTQYKIDITVQSGDKHKTKMKKMIKKKPEVVAKIADLNEDTELEMLMKKATLKIDHNFDIGLGKYTFPIEKRWKPVQKTDELYGPFGTQWIHEKQKHDNISPLLKKRGKQYDKLRAVILPEQRTPEWFEMREGKITASDGASVIGRNKYEAQYKFVLKKTVGAPFNSNKYCYHGKKYEEIATMIYQYRMNVTVEEFGLMGHPKINYLGASPDGICNKYKLNGKHKSQFVGRMLEIKCPLSRQIKMDGPILDGTKGICPEYYWVQVQLQLECCELEECDFWQCELREYPNREMFLEDTSEKEPFRSIHTGFEKGVVIQLLPKDRMKEAEENYWDVVYDAAIFLYPPVIEMSPHDCDKWIAKTIDELPRNEACRDFYFDRVLYWRLDKSKNVTIQRDREWFAANLPTYKKVWDYVLFFREHKEKLDLWVRYIETCAKKRNNDIMNVAHRICDPSAADYADFMTDLSARVALKEVKMAENEVKHTTFNEKDFADQCFLT